MGTKKIGTLHHGSAYPITEKTDHDSTNKVYCAKDTYDLINEINNGRIRNCVTLSSLGIDTYGTTLQLFVDIQDKNLPVTTLVIGKIHCSDMPEGLGVAEIEFTIQDANYFVGYARLHSCDVAPYEWFSVYDSSMQTVRMLWEECDYAKIDTLETQVNTLNTTKASITDVTTLGEQIAQINNDITNVKTPLFANTISDMTDASEYYVLLTDGYIYKKIDSVWTSTGVQYQTTGIAKESVDQSMTTFLSKERTHNVLGINDVAETTLNGITYSVNNNELHVVGTASAATKIYIPLIETLSVAVGEKYYMFCDASPTTYIYVRDSSNTSASGLTFAPNIKTVCKTITTAAELSQIYISIATDTTIDMTIKLWINKASQYAFEPYYVYMLKPNSVSSEEAKSVETEILSILNDGYYETYIDNWENGKISQSTGEVPNTSGEITTAIRNKKYLQFPTDYLRVQILSSTAYIYLLEYNADYTFNKYYVIRDNLTDDFKSGDKIFFLSDKLYKFCVTEITADCTENTFFKLYRNYGNVYSGSIENIEYTTLKNYNNSNHDKLNDETMYIMQGNIGTCISYNGDMTLPIRDAGKTLKVALISDIHIGANAWGNTAELQNYDNLNTVANFINSNNIDFALSLGDGIDGASVNSVTTSEFQETTYRTFTKKIKVPFIDFAGNHDYNLLFLTRRGVAKFNGVKFIFCLGTWASTGVGYNATFTYSADDLTWIEEQLQDSEADKFVLCSHCSFIDDKDGYIGQFDATTKTAILNLCDTYGVKLILSGHEHDNTYYTQSFNAGTVTNISLGTTENTYSILTIVGDTATIDVYDITTCQKDTTIGTNGTITLSV